MQFSRCPAPSKSVNTTVSLAPCVTALTRPNVTMSGSPSVKLAHLPGQVLGASQSGHAAVVTGVRTTVAPTFPLQVGPLERYSQGNCAVVERCVT